MFRPSELSKSQRVVAATALVVVIGLLIFTLATNGDPDQTARQDNVPVETTVPPVTSPPLVSTQTTVQLPTVTTATTAVPKAAAPAPDSSLQLLEPSNFTSKGSIAPFNRVVLPLPSNWDQPQSDPGAIPFADISTCTASTDKCPTILFVDMASSFGREHYTANPVAWWAANSCDGKNGKEAAKGPTMFTVGGVQVQYYRRVCTTDDIAYLWYIPDKQLLVLGRPGRAGGLAAEIIQAVLVKAHWL